MTHGQYTCHMRGKIISCSSFIEKDLHENLVVNLSNLDSNEIEEMTIEDSLLIVVQNDTFNNFKNLQRLHLKNTQTRHIEEGAFVSLRNLQTLSLADNYLEQIESNLFPVNNSLHTLDVSHNLLGNLSNFDARIFPSLTIMNISHNRLEYLPDSIMTKLEEVNTFYLIVDNNPWNCRHPKWVHRLTDVLIEAFCTNHVYDSSEVEAKMAALEYVAVKTTSPIPECFLSKCSLANCLWWIFGSIWIGVILGNICKLKRLLFTQPRRYEDKNTQCDKTDLLSKLQG